MATEKEVRIELTAEHQEFLAKLFEKYGPVEPNSLNAKAVHAEFFERFPDVLVRLKAEFPETDF